MLSIRDTLFQAGTDVEAELYGEPILFYCDAKNVNVTTDKYYHFESWDAMVSSPIFFGHTFDEVKQDIILYF